MSPAASANDTLHREHALALRMWGRLQNELSAERQQEDRDMAKLRAEVLRLRAALLITRTAVLWGISLGSLPLTHLATHALRATNPSPVDEVLCQTGCVGHAHHWLDDHERCSRSGLACHRLTTPG